MVVFEYLSLYKPVVLTNKIVKPVVLTKKIVIVSKNNILIRENQVEHLSFSVTNGTSTRTNI